MSLSPTTRSSTTGAVERTSTRYVVGVSTAAFGIYFALFTPVMVAMAFKIQRIDPENAVASLGLVLGAGAAFALFANPLFGRLSDRSTARWGKRRPFVLGGTLVGAAALVLIGFTTSVPVVLAGWCLAQAGLNAALSAVVATLHDQVEPAGRGKVSGLIGVGTPLSILAGSVVANATASDVLRFTIPAAVAAVLAVAFCLVLEDKVRTVPPTEKFGAKEFFGSFVFNPRHNPDFGWTWLTKFLVMFGYAGIATYLPYYLTSDFGLVEQEATGVILTANLVSTVAMVVSSPLGGLLSDRIGRRKPFVTAAGLVMVAGLLLLALAPSIPVLVVAQGIIGLGAGAFLSVDQALATQVLPNPEDAAKDLGVLNMANALPQSVAPAMAPAIIGLGSAAGIGGYTTWYLFGALVALSGAILVYRIKGVR
ncbi:MFS transporter [Isoptericola halotolerans]|uniref:MFS family permease n=1 Tax=Isoptericola halotolerans TaxID=300560 RepID=A0ABX2A2D1_9MICO|nr:MFS transporter [Isoptericola halotolerans]NOV96861.1 MFS family permease [Isoptericola halotolerans]